jgi:hypothetical protein
MTLEDCKSALEKSSACSALSHHNGKCFLHDRTAADYLSFAQSHSKHVVKMLSGVDECLVYDAPLHHARRFYYGASLGLSVPWERKFFMYDHPAFDYETLVKCYQDEYGTDPWIDERRHEMAQNTASLWLHESFKRHPLRTLDPEEASLFVMPIETYVSASLNKPCRMPVVVKDAAGEKSAEDPTPPSVTTSEGVGTEATTMSDGVGGRVAVTWQDTTAESRNAEILRFLQESPYWKSHGGKDHLVICAWWGAAKSWGKWHANNKASLWKLMRSTAILATIDEYFARDWNKVLVVPYVAHAMMTKWRKEPLPPLKELATAHPVLRKSRNGIGSEAGKGKKQKKWNKKKRAKQKQKHASAMEKTAKDEVISKEVMSLGGGVVVLNATTLDGNNTILEVRNAEQAGENEGGGDDDDEDEEGHKAGDEDTEGDDEDSDEEEEEEDGSGETVMVVAKDPELDTINRNVTFFFRGGILHGVDCKRKVELRCIVGEEASRALLLCFIFFDPVH